MRVYESENDTLAALPLLPPYTTSVEGGECGRASVV